jgi:hypothetical protein
LGTVVCQTPRPKVATVNRLDFGWIETSLTTALGSPLPKVCQDLPSFLDRYTPWSVPTYRTGFGKHQSTASERTASAAGSLVPFRSLTTMPRPKTEGLIDALISVFVSLNEHDSNGESANVVDALFAAGRMIRHGLKECAPADYSNRVADALQELAKQVGRVADALTRTL